MNVQEMIQYTPFSGLDFNQLLVGALLGILIILGGVLIGKAISYLLKKIAKKSELEKHMRGSFIELFIAVVRWSIYLVALDFAIMFLEIPSLSNFVGNLLITIPSIVGGLIILSIGYILAVYLKEIIEDAEITGWEVFSKLVFYFVTFVFGIYALRTALIPLNEFARNWIMIVLVGSIATSLGILLVKNHGKKIQ